MHLRHRFVAVVSIVLLAALGTSSPAAAAETKITNGQDADAGEYPFMVSLQAPGGGHFCGGSLIDDEWVLTAAHCIDGAAVEVVIGGRDLQARDGTRVAVTEQIVHPDYDPNTSLNDIALLRLASPQQLPTLELADAADGALEAPGRIVTLTGWGGVSNDQQNQQYPNTLQEAEMPVLQETDCRGQAGFENYDDATLVCAGAPEQDADAGVDACQGDSGGPLFADDGGTRVQIGLVSYGPTCGYTPTAYTQVSAFTDFIADTIGDAPAPEPEPAPEADFPGNAVRVSGPNRYATAAAFAANGWDGPIETMYLVTGRAFADALAVAPLAKQDAAPVVLTDTTSLPGETASVIESLAPGTIVIVGGTAAVSQAVADQVQAVTGTVPERIAGTNRFETAALVSQRVASDGLPESFPSIFVASGESFADALGGAAAAAADPSSPLLLTQRDALPQATADEISRLAPETVFVLGGTAAVSEGVVASIGALGTDVVRIAGNDRYATSAALALQIFGSSTDAVIASGTAFPDGLVAGAAGLPLLLVPQAGTSVPQSVLDAVGGLGVQFLTVMGGTGAVSDGQAAQVGAAR